jgi:hypothetical protein
LKSARLRYASVVGDAPFLPKTGFRRFFPLTPVKRSLVLWVLLIVLFLAIWQVITPGTSGSMPPVTRPSDSSEFWRDSLVSLLPALGVAGLFVGIFFFSIRRMWAFNAASASAQKALGEGDYARAVAEYEAIEKRYRWPSSLRSIGNFNLAVALMHRGDLANALERFAEVERKAPWSIAGLRASLAGQLALGYALRGELDAARRWRTESEARKQHAGDQVGLAGLQAFADAVIDTREGKCEAFLRWIDERWRELEGTLTARTTRPLRVLRAFAMARSGGVRDAGVVDAALGAIRPARRGEFEMLGTQWPEMHSFLETHGLG